MPVMLESEAVAQRCSVKKVFLEITQNSQENTCARDSFLNKVAGLRPEASIHLFNIQIVEHFISSK